LMLFHNLIFFFLSSNITDGTCSVEINLVADISPHSDTSSWFRVNQFLLLVINTAC
jgi:hypothetical protein